MNILAVDTALSACSVAILMDKRTVVRRIDMARGHAEALMPLLAEAMAEAKLGYGDIDRFAVTVGPGTFTGVRVGVSTVRGLMLTTDRPAVGVTTLEALSETARSSGSYRSCPLLIAMDARRDEIYAQVFDEAGIATSDPMVIGIEALLADLPADIDTVFGSAARAVADAAAGTGREMTALGTDTAPDPLAIARIARDREAKIWPEFAPKPLYLRAPDAKPQQSAVLARKPSAT